MGYYPSDIATCTPCINLNNCEDCDTENSAGVCTTCLNNFYLSSTGTCSELPNYE